MRVDRDALEMVLQTGGEMFGGSVFGMPDLAPLIVRPPENHLEAESRLNKTQLRELVPLLEGAARWSFEQHHGTKVGFTLSGGHYFANKECMASVKPSKDASPGWFTPRALSEYKQLSTKPTVRALLMALFLKTLELV